jgi:hypothetical protein
VYADCQALMLGPKGLELERSVVERHRVTFFGGTTGIGATCPVCGHLSGRVHSRHARAVAEKNTRDASYSCPSFLLR